MGVRSLNNVYEIIKLNSPIMADAMREDVVLVGLGEMCEDKSQVQDAVERLRTQARNCSGWVAQWVDEALEEMGYDLA